MVEGDISFGYVLIFLGFMFTLPFIVILIGNWSKDNSFRRGYNQEMMRQDIRDRDLEYYRKSKEDN